MMTQYLQRVLKPLIGDAVALAIVTERKTRDEQMQSIERFRGLAVAEGLRHLFQKKHFDICQLRNCLEAAQVIPDGETMRLLAPLHCRDYADMPAALRDEIFSRTMAMFGVGVSA